METAAGFFIDFGSLRGDFERIEFQGDGPTGPLPDFSSVASVEKKRAKSVSKRLGIGRRNYRAGSEPLYQVSGP